MTALIAATCALGGGQVARAATPPLLDLRGCELTLHVFMDDPSRLQPRFVPSAYRPLAWIPGKPYIALWSTSCDAVSVHGRPARPAHISIAAVAVEHPDRPSWEQMPAEMPNLWAHYVHRVHSDDADVVAALSDAGMPARLSEGMTLERRVVTAGGLPGPIRAIAETRVGVPGGWSSWTRPAIQHEPAHSHLNTFFHDVDGGTAVLELRIPLAQDHFCELAIGAQCGTVAAEDGSDAAALLGGTARSADAAVDHDPIARGVAMAYRVDTPR